MADDWSKPLQNTLACCRSAWRHRGWTVQKDSAPWYIWAEMWMVSNQSHCFRNQPRGLRPSSGIHCRDRDPCTWLQTTVMTAMSSSNKQDLRTYDGDPTQKIKRSNASMTSSSIGNTNSLRIRFLHQTVSWHSYTLHQESLFPS